jgi:phosphoglycerate dehydrogenase-like enzyme
MKQLLICSYLEPEFIEQIRQVGTDVRVHYHPDLLPRPRYVSDHIGDPLIRSSAQRRQWYKLLEEAEILFDFDHVDIDGFRAHARRARWIQASSAGIGQFVKRHALHTMGATLTTAAGIHARPLAEFVLWSVLAFVKDSPLASKQQREHCWKRFCGDDLEGKVLAIIGLGSVGREVAVLARAVGLKVIGAKRSIKGTQASRLGVDRLYPMSALQEMLGEADFVCLALPHTPETEGLMDHYAFKAMKSDSVLINIGRGSLVEEEALLNALTSGTLRGAVLDVAPQEPLPPEHPLWSMDNVIIFPHSASTSRNENRRLVNLFCDNLERYLEGRPLRNIFDPERLY